MGKDGNREIRPRLEVGSVVEWWGRLAGGKAIGVGKEPGRERTKQEGVFIALSTNHAPLTYVLFKHSLSISSRACPGQS